MSGGSWLCLPEALTGLMPGSSERRGQHVAACFVHPQPFHYIPFPLVLYKELGSGCLWLPAPSG